MEASQLLCPPDQADPGCHIAFLTWLLGSDVTSLGYLEHPPWPLSHSHLPCFLVFTELLSCSPDELPLYSLPRQGQTLQKQELAWVSFKAWSPTALEVAVSIVSVE